MSSCFLEILEGKLREYQLSTHSMTLVCQKVLAFESVASEETNSRVAPFDCSEALT